MDSCSASCCLASMRSAPIYAARADPDRCKRNHIHQLEALG
jgi:hypothetical protein